MNHWLVGICRTAILQWSKNPIWPTFFSLLFNETSVFTSVGKTRGQGIVRVVVVLVVITFFWYSFYGSWDIVPEVASGQYLKPMTCQVEAEWDCYMPIIYIDLAVDNHMCKYGYAKTTYYGGPSTCLICIYENL